MRLNHLVVLEALLRTRSPTAAARELEVTQSAVSKTLATLRQELGDGLMVRRGDIMVLTPRAERLREPLASSLRSVRAVLEGAAAASVARPTRVVVAMRDQFVLALGPALVREFAASSPPTQVHFVPYSRERIGNDLFRGAVDVAVAVDPPEHPGLKQATLYREQFVCVAPGKRLTLHRYLDEGHVATSAHPGYEGIDAALAKLGHRRRIVAYTPYFTTAAHLAEELGLIATLPARVAASLSLRKLQVHPLPLALPGFKCRLIWDGRVDADPASQWLRDTIRRCVRT